ncbi:hypothetical protein C8Q80DRAFT_930404 [Daedaleopsis nitida]|nr:hypothetical protein C8Q80DRAFT_930404 [Daedaleopsis nitida]
MAPPTGFETLSQLRQRQESAGDEPNQSLNPLDSGFGGPATTVVKASGSGSLLVDPTGTSHSSEASTTTSASASDNLRTPSITLSPSPSPSLSAQSSTDSGFGRVTHEVLVGLAAVLSVLIVAGIALIVYLHRRRRRKSGQPQTRERRTARRTREVDVMDGATSVVQDSFANRHTPWRPLPAIPSQEKRGTQQTMKTVRYATDAGSVYVLDGESIYGDNGASVRGILPPAYDDLPSRAGTSEPPPTPSTEVDSAPPRVSDPDGDVESSGRGLPTSQLHPSTSGPSRHGNRIYASGVD